MATNVPRISINFPCRQGLHTVHRLGFTPAGSHRQGFTPAGFTPAGVHTACLHCCHPYGVPQCRQSPERTTLTQAGDDSPCSQRRQPYNHQQKKATRRPPFLYLIRLVLFHSSIANVLIHALRIANSQERGTGLRLVYGEGIVIINTIIGHRDAIGRVRDG